MTNLTDLVRVAVYRAAALHLAYLHGVDQQIAADHAEAHLLGRRPTVLALDAPQFARQRWPEIEALAELCALDLDPAAWADDFDGDVEMAAGAAVAGAATTLGRAR